MYYLNRGSDEGQEQLVAETVADIAKLPTSTTLGDATAAVGPANHAVAFGSTALCVETGDTYMLTSNNQWVKYSNGSSGGGGGSSGGELPPVTSEDNGDLLGVVNGVWDKVAPSASGAETFTVTLTENDGAWTADKTIAEILAAYEDGETCAATGEIDAGLEFTLPIALVSRSANAVQFCGSYASNGAEIVIATGINDGSDAWEVGTESLSSKLPIVTANDDGKLLGVVEGKWAKVEPTTGGETFTVTLTYANEEWTSDKTIAEIVEAYAAGKRCVAVGDFLNTGIDVELPSAYATTVGNMTIVMFCSVVHQGKNYTLALAGTIESNTDKWFLDSQVLTELPTVSALDNGSLLGVSGGEWAKVDPQDYYIPVTVTAGSGGAYSATTTASFSDAVAAALAGKNLIAKCDMGTSTADVPLESVAANGSFLQFSRVVHIDAAVLYFEAMWTSSGITLTVKQITITT